MNKPHMDGTLNKKDARLYKDWWTARGHSVHLTPSRVRGPKKKKLFDVYLTLHR